MRRKENKRPFHIRRTALENHLAWQELITADHTTKLRSLSKSIQKGMITHLPSSLPNDYMTNPRFLSEMRGTKNYNVRRDIYGTRDTSPVTNRPYVVKIGNPPDAIKILPTTPTAKPGGIKVYQGEATLPYMKTNISLAHNDYSVLPVQISHQFSKLNKTMDQSQCEAKSREKSLARAGREMALNNPEFFRKLREERREYKELLSKRMTISDVMRDTEKPEFLPSSKEYGAYKQPRKYVVKPPLDQMKAVLSSYGIRSPLPEQEGL